MATVSVRFAFVQAMYQGAGVGVSKYQARRTGAITSSERPCDQSMGFHDSAGAAQNAVANSIRGWAVHWVRNDRNGIESYDGYTNVPVP